MAAKQEINKNTANNMNCSLCTKLINILKHKPEGETELKCEDCGKDDPVVALCVDCELYLCQDCNKYHSKKNSQHNFLSLGDMPSAEKLLYCPEHRKNILDYYCETCEKLLCIYCAKEHAEHTHEPLNKMAAKHRDVLADIIAPGEEMSKSLSKAEANIVSTQEKMKEQASKIGQEIDKYYVEQLQKLNEHHKQLKEQLNDAVTQKEKALKEQLNDVTSLKDELELHEGLEKTPDHKIFSTKKQDVETRMQKVSEQYKRLNTQPVEYDNFEFVPAKSYSFLLGNLFTFANPHTSEVIDLPGIAYCGHKVEFKIVAKDSKGKNCTKGGSQVSVQLTSFIGDITAGEVRDNNDGSYMASFVAEQVGEAKVLVSINGEKIKGSPYSIVVARNYQAIDKPSTTVNNNGSMGKPWGVACDKNGLWAVVDNTKHYVYIFDNKNQLVRKFYIKSGEFNVHRGVAFDSHNHLYVVDHDNHVVQKFDTNGKCLLQFGSRGASGGQLYHPRGVTVHNDKVYIADYDNKRISVFQTNGIFCISFGSGQLGGPSDVTVSANNHLLVADYNNSCIYTYTLDGHYVGKFGTLGTGRGQLDRPFSLTTDLNGFIIVADSGNHRVSIFDKDHNCIHCFGSNGTANGQFSNPHGIAVSPNGSIYVSDNDNKRIQIFSNF